METDSLWSYDLAQAISQARQLGKAILLQFHRDECAGCKKMYANTYPDAEVQKELFTWFIPVRMDIIKDRAVRSLYSACWTPSFFLLDTRGNVHYQQNGSLNPEAFRMLLRLRKAALDMPRGKYYDVIDLIDDGLDLFPDNPRAATLLFTHGMAEYMLGKEKSSCRGAMTEIVERYPNSQEARMWPWLDQP